MSNDSEAHSWATITSANKYLWIAPLPLRLALLDFPLPGITGLVAAPFGFPFAPGVPPDVPLDAPEPLYVPNQLLGAFLALLELVFGELVAGYE
jgi:hypothetical protein